MLVLMVVPLLILVAVKKIFFKQQPRSIDKKHVVITGGSSGIGLSVAKLAAKKGANVTIIARNLNNLLFAKDEIKKSCIYKEQRITTVSVDVSNKAAVDKELNELERSVGPIFMLVNCAGMATCGVVEDLTEETTKTLINANYLGTLYPIQAVVPKFKERQEGIIVLTSSGAGLMGLYGLSVYSSCKFALRGLAESIHMELKPYNISVTVALPPDTDTPGLAAENENKPEETKLISGAAGLYQPEVVAEKMLEDALLGNFFSYVGFESCILANLCAGMAPFSSYLELLIQSSALGFLRIVSAYYILSFESIVKKCKLAKNK